MILTPVGLMAGVLADPGDGMAVMVLAAAIALGAILPIVNERAVDLGGALPASTCAALLLRRPRNSGPNRTIADRQTVPIQVASEGSHNWETRDHGRTGGAT